MKKEVIQVVRFTLLMFLPLGPVPLLSDPSRFDLPLPQIKDDGDLVAFITKYQDAFLKDVIIYLGGEESSSVPCSREVKLFWTPVNTVKLAKVRSPSLEHQVCSDFTRAMEIDSLRGQISTLDDAHESTKDELLKVRVDLQESQEEHSHTRFLLCHSREEDVFERDNTVRLARERVL
ncbi:hypothetical protein F0562_034339 [Nyssa sinensis]|uniref:Uncharacterized protein n=1 Tax=Nyssa sinensis TaxID=561372 RepID=A0A5J5AHU9_9ASTE|nr:hypothetical protein F0562_034339 [Nyssa sinensis]